MVSGFHRDWCCVCRQPDAADSYAVAYLSFNCPYRRLFRRRRIADPDGFRGFLVPPPFELLPVGLTG
jgi:hypothetical protein